MSTIPETSIDQLLVDLPRVMAEHPLVLLEAPPGAGKTTRVPMALLGAPWLQCRRILVLEPRRLAAKSAAWYMAHLLGEEVGNTVGFRTRYESAVSSATRIEVVTEGILTRRLQSDPELDGVGVVIFDEFHERNLDGDLALALCRDVQGGLRDDLRLLLMSATLDTDQIARALEQPPLLRCEGRRYPVELRYVAGRPREDAIAAVVAVVCRALNEIAGSILVFLPGEGEIRKVEAGLRSRLDDSATLVFPLYGNLTPQEQERALEPAPEGKRKIVLATSIAETSLTIEGIEAVVDSGLMRVPRFDPTTAMTRLETVRVTRAAAQQRAGRAGRLGPGVCYRLWSESQHAGLLAQREPEIMEADLAPLVLELGQWGVVDTNQLRWIDPPPRAPLEQARDLLLRLSALDPQGRITAAGKQMSTLPLHPRLAHMLLRAKELGCAALACWLAAVISERDPLRSAADRYGCDITARIGVLLGRNDPVISQSLRSRLQQVAGQLARRLGITLQQHVDMEKAGQLLAYAYPDRVAQQRDAAGRFLLSNGRGAALDLADPLSKAEFLVVCQLGGKSGDGRVYLAAALRREELESALASDIETTDEIAWDEARQSVVARRLRRLGALVLESKVLPDIPESKRTGLLLAMAQKRGLEGLPWDESSRQWLARVRLVGKLCADPDPRWGVPAQTWPDFSDGALVAQMSDWLEPFLSQVRSLTDLDKIGLVSMLQSRLNWEQQQLLQHLAPERIEVPSGSWLRIDYCAGDVPVLAARLQELFGARETPSIGDGKIPLLIHLLSPAGRPVQITRDLPGFWRGSYEAVRKDMKGRYPKHNWPENPAEAVPHRGVRPKR